MSTETPKLEVQPVTDAELQETLTIPATFSNKFYVSSSAAGVRLTFSEWRGVGDIPRPRCAVFLSPLDTLALRDVLSHQLKNFSFQEVKPENNDG